MCSAGSDVVVGSTNGVGGVGLLMGASCTLCLRLRGQVAVPDALLPPTWQVQLVHLFGQLPSVVVEGGSWPQEETRAPVVEELGDVPGDNHTV